MRALRVGTAQLSALDVYCLDPAGYDPVGAFEVRCDSVLVLDQQGAEKCVAEPTTWVGSWARPVWVCVECSEQRRLSEAQVQTGAGAVAS